MTQKINDKSQGEKLFTTEFNKGIKNPIQSVMELLGMNFVADAPLQTPLSFSIFNNLFQNSCVAVASSDPKIQVVNLKAPFEALSSNIKLEDGLTLKYKVLSAPDSIQDLSINFNNLGAKPIKDRFLTRNFVLKSGSYVELTYKVDDDCFVLNSGVDSNNFWNPLHSYKKNMTVISPLNNKTYIAISDISGNIDPSLDVALVNDTSCQWQPLGLPIGSIVFKYGRTVDDDYQLMDGSDIRADGVKLMAENVAQSVANPTKTVDMRDRFPKGSSTGESGILEDDSVALWSDAPTFYVSTSYDLNYNEINNNLEYHYHNASNYDSLKGNIIITDIEELTAKNFKVEPSIYQIPSSTISGGANMVASANSFGNDEAIQSENFWIAQKVSLDYESIRVGSTTQPKSMSGNYYIRIK